MITPRMTPTATPMNQPTAAMPSVVAAAVITGTISGGVSPPLVDWKSRAPISHRCGIARSLVRGRIITPDPVSPSTAPTTKPSAGPRNL